MTLVDYDDLLVEVLNEQKKLKKTNLTWEVIRYNGTQLELQVHF